MSWKTELNGHVVGRVAKDMVRRAIVEIRARRFIFDAESKPDAEGELTDVVTDADKVAQAIYQKGVGDCFPGHGFVAEEGKLVIPCTLSGQAVVFWTADGVDGTKAYTRRQSQGVGTMVSLVCGSEVICAYVGDALTGETYGFHPESDKVHRIPESGRGHELKIDPRRLLRGQYLLFRDEPARYEKWIREMSVRNPEVFKSFEVEGGSIGLSFARLWKGEVGAIALKGGTQNPWDIAPTWGISRKMGFVFLRLTDQGVLEQVNLPMRQTPYVIGYNLLVLHSSRLEELG